jgi:hypothetical protein
LGVNSTNTANWQNDTDASVAQYNTWFRTSAPAAFQGARAGAMALVSKTMLGTSDLLSISVASLKAEPTSLAILRMATAPPLARDRLAGLSGVSRGLVETLEEGFLPTRMIASTLRGPDFHPSRVSSSAATLRLHHPGRASRIHFPGTPGHQVLGPSGRRMVK